MIIKLYRLEEAKITTHPLLNKFIQQNKEKIHKKFGSKEKILSLQDKSSLLTIKTYDYENY